MFEYSQRAFETQYSIIKDILINGKIPNVYPKAYILGGQPGAGKSNIQRWLKRKDKNIITTLLNLPKPPKPDDTADALALAICHGHAGSNVLSKYIKM